MKKVILSILICLCVCVKAFSQSDGTQVRGITTAAPFLLITPDARAGGMGDVGVATTADAFSLFHNPAKIAFSDRQVKAGITYSPWLRNLADDIFIGSASYINRFSENAAWGGEIRFFSLGQIDLTDNQGNVSNTVNPNELVISGTYSLLLSETFSMGIGLKYLRSDLAFTGTTTNTLEPVNSFAVDVSGYYQSKEENYGNFNGRYRLGFNITNLGPKVSYSPNSEDFIPTNLKLGGGFDFILDDYNTVSATLEFTKLLVPTPPIRENGDEDGDGVPNEIIEGKDDNIGFVEGVFSSFGDAPGGFSEELQEFTYALGAEYLYNNAFAVRGGYFNESQEKGNRQFFTLGAGFKTNSLNIDLSYLINASDVNNPLENTLRFSLSFDLGEVFESF